MSDTVFEVNVAAPLGMGEGPACMSSPLQSPIEEKDGHLTMKSDDSGIIMDESTFSMNDTMSEPTSPAVSPQSEEDIVVNGHMEEEDNIQNCDTMITDLINAMDDSAESASVPVPQITIDSAETSEEQEEDDSEPAHEQNDESSPQTEETDDTVPQIEQPAEVEETKTEQPHIEVTIEEEQPKTEEPAEGEEIKTEEPSSEEVHAEVEEQKEEEQEEEEEESEEEEEEEEDDRVDFVRDIDYKRESLRELEGIRCDDVWTALEILKTRYRLTPAVPKTKPRKLDRKSPAYHTLPRAKTRDKTEQFSTDDKESVSSPTRKSIITWSCWNISDMVHPLSNRSSWLPTEPEKPEKDENANIKVMNTDIDTKQAEICDLLKKVLKEEDDKKEPEVPEDRLKDPAAADAATAPEDKVEQPIVEAPVEAEKVPEAEATPPKKKKGNVFQRMVRAVRKRFGRNRQSTSA